MNLEAFLTYTILFLTVECHGWKRQRSRPLSPTIDEFSAKLINKLSSSYHQQNFVFSPFSIYSALSVIGRGAASETLEQIEQVLNTKDFEKVQKISKELGTKSNGYNTSFAQRIFVAKDTKLKKTFKNFINESGQQFVKKLSFGNNPQGSIKRINKWVAKNTDDLIKKLVKPNQVTSNTKVVFVNALALKAKWLIPFSWTEEEPFMTFQNKMVQTNMLKGFVKCMIHEEHPEYWSRKLKDLGQFVVVRLPFEGENLVYTVVMPTEPRSFRKMKFQHNMDSLLDYISSTGLNEDFSNCDVTMPKFDLEFDYDVLKKHLLSLGVRDAFTGMADFSRMCRSIGKGDLMLSDLAHKAAFRLDESGVDAAAATAAFISSRMMPPSVTIDRPFYFFVHETDAKAVLFAGRFVAPQ